MMAESLLIERYGQRILAGENVAIRPADLDAMLFEIDVVIGHRARGPLPALPKPRLRPAPKRGVPVSRRRQCGTPDTWCR